MHSRIKNVRKTLDQKTFFQEYVFEILILTLKCYKYIRVSHIRANFGSRFMRILVPEKETCQVRIPSSFSAWNSAKHEIILQFTGDRDYPNAKNQIIPQLNTKHSYYFIILPRNCQGGQ